jgi:hypothetical protein
VQDFSLEGRSIDEVRASQQERLDVQLEITGLGDGTYTITPYDTWQGIYLEDFDVDCADDRACAVDLPDFTADMAFKIERQ